MTNYFSRCIVRLNGRLDRLSKRYTVIHRFRLIISLVHLIDRLARLIDCLARIMAKRQVTDCLPFSILENIEQVCVKIAKFDPKQKGGQLF